MIIIVGRSVNNSNIWYVLPLLQEFHSPADFSFVPAWAKDQWFGCITYLFLVPMRRSCGSTQSSYTLQSGSACITYYHYCKNSTLPRTFFLCSSLSQRPMVWLQSACVTPAVGKVHWGVGSSNNYYYYY